MGSTTAAIRRIAAEALVQRALGAQRFATAIEGLRRLRPIRAGASAVALAGFLVTPASAALLPQAACDRPRDLPTNAFEVQRAFTGRFEVVTQAVARLEPAQLSWGSGIAHFVMNRREFTPNGVILGVNPRATVVDITHEIPAADIRAGAFALAASCRKVIALTGTLIGG